MKNLFKEVLKSVGKTLCDCLFIGAGVGCTVLWTSKLYHDNVKTTYVITENNKTSEDNPQTEETK